MVRLFRKAFCCVILGGGTFYTFFFGMIVMKTMNFNPRQSKTQAREPKTVQNWESDVTKNEICSHVPAYSTILEFSNYVTSFYKNSTWQNVSFCDSTYVYSALYRVDIVYIIATTTRHSLLNKTMQYKCRYFNDITFSTAAKTCIQTFAERKRMPENRGKRYSAAFFTCPLPPSSHPYAVSLSADHCKTPSNALPILYPQKQKRQFTVCVTPLNFKYSKAYELVEMIEMNRILGAEHFVFYNYSTSYNVDKVLDYYKKLGIVEVLEWNLPMKVDTWPKTSEPVEIHYFAQLAALNDCLYRNMHVSKYVVFEDLDEFIIPRVHKTWGEMLQTLPSGYGAYMFRCAFFRKEWSDVNTEFLGKLTAKQYKMNTLLKQNREAKILGKTHRSKYIVDPTKIDTVGIHNIWRFRSSQAYFVDPKVAIMHHYRDWLNPNDYKTAVFDDRIMAYSDELLQNTKYTWEKLKNVPLGPLDNV